MPSTDKKLPKWYFWGLFVLLLAIDQVSKELVLRHIAYGNSIVVIPNFFSLTFVKNDGVAWGMMQGNNLLLGAIVCVVLVVAIWWARSLNWRSVQVNILAATILAGALGNLIDRFRLGYVVDFADFLVPIVHYRWPAFNVADSCISLSVVWLILTILFTRKHEATKS